jgi:hypothetical protein
VWVSKRAEESAHEPEPRMLPLPTITLANRNIRFRVKQMGIRRLDVTLAFHPGWDIAHPLEAEGRAIRMWPPVVGMGGADFRGLPAVHARDTIWMDGPRLRFAPGRYEQGGLPPIDPTFDIGDPVRMFQLGVVSASG